MNKLEKFKELFPESISDEKIDIGVLKQILGEHLKPEPERFEFTWVGKKESLKSAETATDAILEPCPEESVDWDTTQNIFIEGDNLDALKILQKDYFGKVKMIYIDPPYNTGKKFVYGDKFQDSVKVYKRKRGIPDKRGYKLSNSEESDRRHSNWLNMMLPRLYMAKNLLNQEGVIFISIDDNEIHNLRSICDEIFGEENFINQISIKSKPSSGASGGGEDVKLKKNIEYLVCYCKDKESFPRFNDVYDEKDLITYINEYRNEGKSWKYTRVLKSFGTKEHYKDITDGSGQTIKIYKHANVEISTLKDLENAENLTEEEAYLKYFEKIFRDTNAQSSIRQKVIDATDNDDNFYSIEYYPISGRSKGKLTTLHYKGRNKNLIAWLSDVASKYNNRIVKREKVGTFWGNFNWNNVSKEGSIQFPNGKKPIRFIQRLISLCSDNESEDVIIDFFAGSGSTAHAVFAENMKDGGKRKNISVQLPELIDDKVKKTLYSSDDLKSLQTIADIGKERIRRAATKIKEENPDYNGDLGFKVFKIKIKS